MLIRDLILNAEKPSFVLTARKRQQLEAEELLKTGLAARRKTLLAVHPDTAISLEMLGRCLLDTCRYRDAEPVLREALSIHRQALVAIAG